MHPARLVDGFTGALVVVPITLHDEIAACAEFALFADRDDASLLVDDFYFGVGLDAADRRYSFFQRIVDAGAERIGIVLGETATAHDWASLIDHTLLKPEAMEAWLTSLLAALALPKFGLSTVFVVALISATLLPWARRLRTSLM